MCVIDFFKSLGGGFNGTAGGGGLIWVMLQRKQMIPFI